ncbi:cell division control protein 6 [Halalkaliarchaeum desulfuricum]|uniref:ORC1-type DNA replication protein n=1 Tax=Halalkaliarchaeum desulfuricum TaxID=2055893 RepID=A0A343TN54_9EURY|nr:orc1/cdc6 family replication initiation protein [Halalkaliarchaeum desulfuricum]AUX10526.1 cell division control protein 6 [Halalkaliarchaeum desulfuricum]
MSGPFSDVSRTIFADKEVLSEGYQPETILEREAEIELYRNAFKDVLFGHPPPNVFIYGKTGVGKTAVTRYILDALQEEVDGRPEADDLTVLWHNCNGETPYSTARAFINDLKPAAEDPFPRRGYSLPEALERFYDLLDRRGGTFLLVLDEIDHLKESDTLLYELPRARANDHVDDAQLGVVGISNNYAFRESLSPKVKDTLMEREISFAPYSADELRTILEHRASMAFRDDGYDPSAIGLCAALAARDTGNARQALDLLLNAGDIAEERGDDAVTDEHVSDAEERVRRGRVLKHVRDQTIHAQLVLETVARLQEDGHAPVRSKTIYDAYTTIAEEWGHDPLSSLKSVQNHLSDLHMLGFLTRHEHNDGRAGGSYYTYEVEHDAAAIVDVRERIEDDRP